MTVETQAVAPTVDGRALFTFDNTFLTSLPGLFQPWQAEHAPNPQLLVLNDALAAELGVDPDALRAPSGVDVLVGNVVPDGATPVAQAYSGHQFGGFSPRLGDGRALLLGEVVDTHGHRRDLHLKGSGRTPFSRGGDGKAAVGPMLREHVIGEAMHALGIPTTRSLAVVATGDTIRRDTPLPGAVLCRVAASHLRVGTFQFAAAHGDTDLVRRLADYAVARHHPQAAEAANSYLALLDSVADVQASLVAQWMLVGFVHGVMNTDNMTISGETIDYGPCAFIDAYDPATVFSSIDHGGRYAFGNQPGIARWNLARLAETLLPLIDDDSEAAISAAMEVLDRFPATFEVHWQTGLRTKLGLTHTSDASVAGALIGELLELMRVSKADFTQTFRGLAASLRGDDTTTAAFTDPVAFAAWAARWHDALAADSRPFEAIAASMDAVNPVYIPRNHLVDAALTAGSDGDLGPVRELLDVLADPFTERAGFERYAEPAAADAGPFVTFCGT
ncbi:MAG: YdiU family protein [Ilumatobacteraceae bacterium]|nr:YdiU family protein [Ilumatobacteraceae bacterium]